MLRPGGAAVVPAQHPVADWLRKGGSCLPGHPGGRHLAPGDHPVRFWREPRLALCTAATGAGFLIETVIEPVPAKTMRDCYPGDDEKLGRAPGFLILRLRTPARSAPGPAS